MKPRSCSNIRFGDDISPFSTPLISPNALSKRILVIGGGVTALVTSWILLDKGHRVTILSKEWISFSSTGRLTSQIAGALWELPPGGCGPQPTTGALEKSQRWAQESYNVYYDIASNQNLAAEFGVQMRSLAMLFPGRVETNREWEEKMKEIQKREIRGFNRSSGVIEKLKANPTFGIKDTYELDAPIIDSDRAMQWLMEKVQSKGAKLINVELKGSLLDQEDLLLKAYAADAIVNATGLGAQKLALDDSVYPVRGGVFRLLNDGISFPKVTGAAVMNSVTDDTGNYRDLVFMVPRNDDILILGSIVQPHEYELNLNLNSPSVQELRERLCGFMPALKNARLDPKYPFAQGLRPFRVGGPRVERESVARPGRASRIVHSYGHGGAGWSLAFGCAAECVALVEDVLRDAAASAD